MKEQAYIMLSNAQIFEGISFGAKGTAFGEIVFTTGMVGYQQTLTDPAYCGRVIVQTFPLIGNYGVNSEDNESDSVYASGYVVREKCDFPSNFRSEGNLEEFLKEKNVIGIYSVNTRGLTRSIRENGVMSCVITTENIYDKKDELAEILKLCKPQSRLKKVTSKEVNIYKAENAKHSVAMLDLGYRKSVLNEFLSRGCNVTVYPAFTTADEIAAAGHDGIVYSNGTDSPDELSALKGTVKALFQKKIPAFGIDAGHILMALSSGAEIEKLKHGHRGLNQPVFRKKTGTTYVTEQNHAHCVGYIDLAKAEVTHINLNDKTCEGLSYKGIPAFSVQFIPTTSGGAQNGAVFYDEFIAMLPNNSTLKK
ncbi:MAG: carbamoyl phosphate synthase small subunit [Oscillospiraceae bacterium]|nr:carbamoyl phosphate synthase small subunit [Oscillospiraceae bacterium]